MTHLLDLYPAWNFREWVAQRIRSIPQHIEGREA